MGLHQWRLYVVNHRTVREVIVRSVVLTVASILCGTMDPSWQQRKSCVAVVFRVFGMHFSLLENISIVAYTYMVSNWCLPLFPTACCAFLRTNTIRPARLSTCMSLGSLRENNPHLLWNRIVQVLSAQSGVISLLNLL